MFRGPHFIISTMQAGTTPIFKVFGMTGPSTKHQPGIEPIESLSQCLVPPIVAFYNQQGLLRAYSSPGSSIRSPHPGPPQDGPFLAALTTSRGYWEPILPKGQSPSPEPPRGDLIGNEMIKYGGEHLHRSLLKLFNTVLNAGKYPEKWKDSFISPIHKGLVAHKPQNHRGVAVADCISKIFCNIMNGRIVKHLKKQNFWKDNQNWFREGRRTEDNTMIIKPLFEKCMKNTNQRLFMAFVDFRKFYDTMNRKSLLYKMLKAAGITGNLYKVIKPAYDKNRYSIKCSNGITRSFIFSQILPK